MLLLKHQELGLLCCLLFLFFFPDIRTSHVCRHVMVNDKKSSFYLVWGRDILIN
jgi:hypothetical protein